MKKIEILSTKKQFTKKFYDIYEFCKIASAENNYSGIRKNMDHNFWYKNNHSLLYQMYILKKWRNTKGCVMIAYHQNKIIAISGLERYKKDIAILLKRLYVLKDFRGNREMFLPKQIEWCKKYNIKMAMVTINDYNIRMKSMMERFIIEPSCKKNYPIISKFKPHSKMIINNVEQDVYYYKLDKNFEIPNDF